MEEWKDIIGYEGKYQVSNIGNVRSLDYMHTGKTKELKQDTNRYGYKMVRLCKNGNMKAFSVHRLAAIAFIPNPSDYPQVNHKDENKSNNNVDNLEWCTNEYNHNYGTRNKRAAKSCGKKIILTNTGEIFNSTREASKKYNVHNSTICQCLKGVKKSAGKSSDGEKLIWKYYEED